MCLSLRMNRARLLSRAAAVALVAGLAGCSSDLTRFQDGLFTGSTANQRQIIRAPSSQPYPGDAQPDQNGLDSTHTGSVTRSNVRSSDLLAGPLTRDDLQTLDQPAAAPQGTAVATASLPPVDRSTRTASSSLAPAATANGQFDTMSTGSTVRAAAPSQAQAAPRQDRGGGWSVDGGAHVTVQAGDTVYSLSRRYGVPVGEIIQANGLTNASDLVAGRSLVIPKYSYSEDAPVSAPDHDPRLATERINTQGKGDRLPIPVPGQRPADEVAVLPRTAKPERRDEAATASAKAETSKTEPTTTARAEPAKAAAPTGGNYYTVVAGDTLSAIARRSGTSATALKKANGLTSGLIHVGQKLQIPGGATVQVAKADLPANVDPIITGDAGPSHKAAGATADASPAKDDKAITATVENASAAAPNSTGIDRMRWPVRGRVVAAFGAKNGGKSNDGIDISVPEGTPVKAAENGVVIYAGDGLKEFGNTVLMRHEDGLVTVYGNASKLEVSRGDTVKRGQEIALSGMTGNAESPRLHFEVRKDSAPVDPSKFLE